MKSEHINANYETEKITIEVPKGTVAVSVVSTYVNGCQFGMANKIYDSDDLIKLRKKEGGTVEEVRSEISTKQ